MRQGHDDGRQPIGPSSASLAILTSFLWGGTPVAIKYSQDVLPPIGVAAARFLLAAGFMVAWCGIQRVSLKLEPGQRRPALICGLLLYAQIALFHLGLDRSSPSHGSLLINTFVLWVAGIEHFITRTDRLNPRRLGGLMLAASGVGMVLALSGADPQEAAAGFDQPSMTGDLLLLGSGFLLGVKIIYTKQAVRVVPPPRLILWHDVIGMVLFAVTAAALEREQIDIGEVRIEAGLGLLYQGILVAGFCFAVQAQLLKKHVASQISIFSFTTPLFGLTAAMLIRTDAYSPWLLASAGFVALGIWLVQRRESR